MRYSRRPVILGNAPISYQRPFVISGESANKITGKFEDLADKLIEYSSTGDHIQLTIKYGAREAGTNMWLDLNSPGNVLPKGDLNATKTVDYVIESPYLGAIVTALNTKFREYDHPLIASIADRALKIEFNDEDYRGLGFLLVHGEGLSREGADLLGFSRVPELQIRYAGDTPDAPKESHLNNNPIGTKAIATNEDYHSSTINRAIAQLSRNTDALQSILRKSHSVPSKVGPFNSKDYVEDSAGKKYLISQPLYSGTTPFLGFYKEDPSKSFKIVDSDGEVVFNNLGEVKVTDIRTGDGSTFVVTTEPAVGSDYENEVAYGSGYSVVNKKVVKPLTVNQGIASWEEWTSNNIEDVLNSTAVKCEYAFPNWVYVGDIAEIVGHSSLDNVNNNREYRIEDISVDRTTLVLAPVNEDDRGDLTSIGGLGKIRVVPNGSVNEENYLDNVVIELNEILPENVDTFYVTCVKEFSYWTFDDSFIDINEDLARINVDIQKGLKEKLLELVGPQTSLTGKVQYPFANCADPIDHLSDESWESPTSVSPFSVDLEELIRTSSRSGSYGLSGLFKGRPFSDYYSDDIADREDETFKATGRWFSFGAGKHRLVTWGPSVDTPIYGLSNRDILDNFVTNSASRITALNGNTKTLEEDYSDYYYGVIICGLLVSVVNIDPGLGSPSSRNHEWIHNFVNSNRKQVFTKDTLDSYILIEDHPNYSGEVPSTLKDVPISVSLYGGPSDVRLAGSDIVGYSESDNYSNPIFVKFRIIPKYAFQTEPFGLERRVKIDAMTTDSVNNLSYTGNRIDGSGVLTYSGEGIFTKGPIDVSRREFMWSGVVTATGFSNNTIDTDKSVDFLGRSLIVNTGVPGLKLSLPVLSDSENDSTNTNYVQNIGLTLVYLYNVESSYSGWYVLRRVTNSGELYLNPVGMNKFSSGLSISPQSLKAWIFKTNEANLTVSPTTDQGRRDGNYEASFSGKYLETPISPTVGGTGTEETSTSALTIATPVRSLTTSSVRNGFSINHFSPIFDNVLGNPITSDPFGLVERNKSVGGYISSSYPSRASLELKYRSFDKDDGQDYNGFSLIASIDGSKRSNLLDSKKKMSSAGFFSSALLDSRSKESTLSSNPVSTIGIDSSRHIPLVPSIVSISYRSDRDNLDSIGDSLDSIVNITDLRTKMVSLSTGYGQFLDPEMFSNIFGNFCNILIDGGTIFSKYDDGDTFKEKALLESFNPNIFSCGDIFKFSKDRGIHAKEYNGLFDKFSSSGKKDYLNYDIEVSEDYKRRPLHEVLHVGSMTPAISTWFNKFNYFNNGFTDQTSDGHMIPSEEEIDHDSTLKLRKNADIVPRMTLGEPYNSISDSYSVLNCRNTDSLLPFSLYKPRGNNLASLKHFAYIRRGTDEYYLVDNDGVLSEEDIGRIIELRRFPKRSEYESVTGTDFANHFTKDDDIINHTVDILTSYGGGIFLIKSLELNGEVNLKDFVGVSDVTDIRNTISPNVKLFSIEPLFGGEYGEQSISGTDFYGWPGKNTLNPEVVKFYSNPWTSVNAINVNSQNLTTSPLYGEDYKRDIVSSEQVRLTRKTILTPSDLGLVKNSSDVLIPGVVVGSLPTSCFPGESDYYPRQYGIPTINDIDLEDYGNITCVGAMPDFSILLALEKISSSCIINPNIDVEINNSTPEEGFLLVGEGVTVVDSMDFSSDSTPSTGTGASVNSPNGTIKGAMTINNGDQVNIFKDEIEVRDSWLNELCPLRFSSRVLMPQGSIPIRVTFNLINKYFPSGEFRNGLILTNTEGLDTERQFGIKDYPSLFDVRLRSNYFKRESDSFFSEALGCHGVASIEQTDLMKFTPWGRTSRWLKVQDVNFEPKNGFTTISMAPGFNSDFHNAWTDFAPDNPWVIDNRERWLTISGGLCYPTNIISIMVDYITVDVKDLGLGATNALEAHSKLLNMPDLVEQKILPVKPFPC